MSTRPITSGSNDGESTGREVAAGQAQPAPPESRPADVTPSATRPSRVGLAARAVGATRASAARVSHDPATLPPGWYERAARATRILACTLGVDPVSVTAAPDPDRAYGVPGPMGVPEVRLTVLDGAALAILDGDGGSALVLADPGPGAPRNGRYEFICESGRSDVFHLLHPCPGCHQLVPTYRVTSLIDLGRTLLPGSPGRPDSDQFRSDPAHRPGCTRHRVSIRSR